MNKLAKVTIITLIAGMAGFATVNASAYWNGQGGQPGQGAYCNQQGMRSGMPMRFNHKQGRRAQQNLNLTADQAKILVQARLIRRGNDRLKVGEVTAKDDNTYAVQIVTLDNSLVREINIDRNTGFPTRAMANN
jgi:GDP-D-mannose dehydratase